MYEKSLLYLLLLEAVCGLANYSLRLLCVLLALWGLLLQKMLPKVLPMLLLLKWLGKIRYDK